MDSVIVIDSLAITNWPEPTWSDPGVITAIASVFIAAIALLVVLVERRANRKHTRLSVKPKLHLRLEAFVAPDSDWIHLRLDNQGLGPAEIGDSYFEFSGERIPTTASTERIAAKVASILPPGLWPIEITTGGIFPGGWMAPDGPPIQILSLKVFFGNKVITGLRDLAGPNIEANRQYANLNEEQRSKTGRRYAGAFSAFRTVVDYRSAYGEPDHEVFPPGEG